MYTSACILGHHMPRKACTALSSNHINRIGSTPRTQLSSPAINVHICCGTQITSNPELGQKTRRFATNHRRSPYTSTTPCAITVTRGIWIRMWGTEVACNVFMLSLASLGGTAVLYGTKIAIHYRLITSSSRHSSIDAVYV